MDNLTSSKAPETIKPFLQRLNWVLLLSGCTGALSLLTLTLGWGAGIDFLVRIRSSYPAMVPGTAICVFLGSLGLVTYSYGRNKLVGLVCGLTIPAIVVSSFVVPAFDMGTDGMSIGTALASLLLAICLLKRSVPRDEKRQGLFVEPLGLSIVSIPLLGYIFNAEALFSNPIYTEMALQTALGFGTLFVAFLLHDSQVGWMRVLSGRELGSQMLRRLLPIVIFGPIILTGLALFASHRDYLSPDLRAAFLTYIMIVVSVSASIYFAHLTNQSELRLAKAETLRRESERGRQAAELALERGQKIEALGKMVGGVAHDFNNTLSVILGNLQLVQTDTDVSTHDGYINDAVNAVEQAAQLTRQLLAYGRKSRLEPKQASLDELVPESLRMFERLCLANISVIGHLKAGEALVEIDRVNFQQALLNLLINAQDALEGDGGEIVLSTSVQKLDGEAVDGFAGVERLLPGTFVVVTVQDNGSGMAAHEVTRATEPFFTTKPVGEGSGLGLSVAAGFCRQSHGGLMLSSKVGQGTTVMMAFPVVAHVNVDGPDDEAPKLSQPSEQKRILVVDDDVEVVRVMARQLQLDGYDVMTAFNAAEALLSLEDGPFPDLLITDLVMPGAMQGYTLARTIRDRHPEIHVVMMSGYDSIRQHKASMQALNEPFLQKPVNWTLLREVVNAVFSKSAGG